MGMGAAGNMMGATQQQSATPQSQFIQGQPQQYQQPPQQQYAPPPPMPPQQPVYHAMVGGVQQGPFSVAQLQQMAQMGQVMPDTMVWCAGMPGWAAAGTQAALAALFGAAPPPPPMSPPAF
jgi:hypothetical protein